MALQHRLLFLPPGTERISEHLAAAHHDGRLTFFDASGPIFSCREEDEGALRFAAAMLTEPGLGLAGPSQVGQRVYGGLQHGYSGLTAMLLTFGVMALVRIRWGRAPRG